MQKYSQVKRNIDFNIKYYVLIVLFLLVLLVCNIFYQHKEYEEFLEQNYFKGEVLRSYVKTNENGRTYPVLHFKTNGLTIYITPKKIPKSNHLLIKVLNQNISFIDYLKGRIYFKVLEIEEIEDIKEPWIISYFINQHKSDRMKEFYGALFFAKPVSKSLRDDVNYYAIAHLLAISGYHLGLIYAVLFTILAPIYRFFQLRFFPHRSLYVDIGLIVFTALGLYFYLIGIVPSYTRSFLMAFLTFYYVCRAIRIVNFLHLFLVFLLCIALSPSFAFSVGFFFSCLGVFYIFLYIKYYFEKTIVSIVMFEVWVFFGMVIPVLYFFPLLSMQQLLGIIITPLFAIFYPLVLFLHTISHAHILDPFLESFLDFKIYAINFYMPFWAFAIYMLMTFFSMFSQRLAKLTICVNAIPFGIVLFDGLSLQMFKEFFGGFFA